MKKNLYIIYHNNDDNEPQYEIVKSTTPELALLNYIEDIFDLEIEEDETVGNEEYICNMLMQDEFFGVALVQLGGVDFDFYFNLESLRKEVENG